MYIQELQSKRRSIRKFQQKAVAHEDLLALIELARTSASAANRQPLKYAVVDTPELSQGVFPLVKWAGYLPDWNPTPKDAPPAYILIFGDTTISNNFEADAGAAIGAMMLGAVESGLATCWMGAIDRPEIKQLLKIGDTLDLLYVLAVGYPDQESVTVPMENNDCKYYFDDAGILQVPKRDMQEIIIPLPDEVQSSK